RRSLPLSLLTAPASTEIYTLSLHDALPISGVVSAASGAAAVTYVTQALRLAQSQVLDAVVGAPHNEQAIHEAGIAFNGYPGLVARLNGLDESQVFLLLVSPELKIGHVTLHESVKDALRRLTPELVVQAARAVIAATQRM